MLLSEREEIKELQTQALERWKAFDGLLSRLEHSLDKSHGGSPSTLTSAYWGLRKTDEFRHLFSLLLADANEWRLISKK